jgi:hypothetical protein
LLSAGSSPPPSTYAPVPDLTDLGAVQKWTKQLFRTFTFDNTVLSKVVVHTTHQKYNAKHRIGTEFFLETKSNKSLEKQKDSGVVLGNIDPQLIPSLVPYYRLESLDILGDHVYVFEYEGALSHYYPSKPPVIAVKSWDLEMASNFIENYCNQ